MKFTNLFKKNKTPNYFNLLKNKKLLIAQEPELVQQPSFPDSGELTGCGLGFSDNYRLSINNKYSLVNANELKDFMGEKVKNIIFNKFDISFNFTNDKKIIVSIKDEDWEGPEAMVLYHGDKDIYVFRGEE